MKRSLSDDRIVAHYLNGGNDLELTKQRLREVKLLPLFDRPLVMYPDADLYLEIALRRGPRYRCTCCGWMQPGCAIRHLTPDCDNCGGGECAADQWARNFGSANRGETAGMVSGDGADVWRGAVRNGSAGRKGGGQ